MTEQRLKECLTHQEAVDTDERRVIALLISAHAADHPHAGMPPAWNDLVPYLSQLASLPILKPVPELADQEHRFLARRLARHRRLTSQLASLSPSIHLLGLGLAAAALICLIGIPLGLLIQVNGDSHPFTVKSDLIEAVFVLREGRLNLTDGTGGQLAALKSGQRVHFWLEVPRSGQIALLSINGKDDWNLYYPSQPTESAPLTRLTGQKIELGNFRIERGSLSRQIFITLQSDEPIEVKDLQAHAAELANAVTGDFIDQAFLANRLAQWYPAANWQRLDLPIEEP